MPRLTRVLTAAMAIGGAMPGVAAAQSPPVVALERWAGDGFDGEPTVDATGGILRLTSGTIWTPGAHADFVLRFEYRPLSPVGSSALLLRSGIDAQRERQSYEVVLDATTSRGRLAGERQALGPVRVVAPPPLADPSAWIAVEARADFDRLTVSVDGVVVSEAEGAAEGFGTIGIRAGLGGVALRALTLQAIPFPSEMPDGLVTAATPGVWPPDLVHRTAPRYTRAAMAARAQGQATLQMLIGADGRVAALRILEMPPHPDLAVAALACVRRWRFRPAQRSGAPIPFIANAEVVFRLK